MALCGRWEAARAEQEATRDKFTAASLARLDAPDPDAFRDDARFALNTLSALTTRPNQIKQLRQTILNLAMRGKLVPQDRSDEPASELLKRIAAEKARLVKEGKAKRQESLHAPDPSQAPFEPRFRGKSEQVGTVLLLYQEKNFKLPVMQAVEQVFGVGK
jgi:type I restriction enzyme S subunit